MFTRCEVRQILLTGSAIALGATGAGLLLRLVSKPAPVQVMLGGKALPVHRMNRPRKAKML